MKIIDINRKNKNLLVEISQQEYSKIIIALDKVYPPIIVARKRFSEKELTRVLNLTKENNLVVADDEKK